MLQCLISAIIGPTKARKMHHKALQQKPDILSGLKQLELLCPVDDITDKEEPIFLLSAGWRSGSTLLQRLIMSDSNVLMWGEPYDECGTIQLLASSVQAFRADWPPKDYYYDGTMPNKLSGEWIANLFPSPEDLRQSHRALFITMFAEPAKRAGAQYWGIKEVRLGSDHCAYIRWLFPKAKFIFLYRNPLDAYRSYSVYGRNWYNTFPNKPIFTPIAFGKHWKLLMEGFLRDATKLNALVINYEDLVCENTQIEKIEAHLNITINRNVIKNKVGGFQKREKVTDINWLEKQLLKYAVSPIAQKIGYKW
jgi:hypothetical protein